MFAWKSTLLFISVFCSAFLSKYSLGGKCTIGDVYSQIKPILDSVKSPVAGLSYDDTLSLTKRLTSLYFTADCQTPSFCYAFANFSTCQLNKEVYTAVEADIQLVMKDAGAALVNSADLTSDQLTRFADRILSITKIAFLISHRYASTHILLCTNVLLFRYLAAKIPGSTWEANQLLTESIDYCSKGLNDDQYEMMETLYNVDFSENYDLKAGIFELKAEYTYEDQFSWSCSLCSALPEQFNCGCSCTRDDNFRTYAVNAVIKTYNKIFSPAYCELRDKLSLFNTAANIVAVECHDQNFFLEQSFLYRAWFVRNKPDGPTIGTYYNEEHREASGILLSFPKLDNLFINLDQQAIYEGDFVKCKNITVSTRCQIGVPGFVGPCYGR